MTEEMTLLLRWTGFVGVILYLAAYFGVQTGRMSPAGWVYPWINIAAASLVLLSMAADWNPASAVMNGVWIAIGLGHVSLRVAQRRRWAAWRPRRRAMALAPEVAAMEPPVEDIVPR